MTNPLHDFLDAAKFEEKIIELYANGDTLDGEPLYNQRVAYRFTVPAVDYHRHVDSVDIAEIHFESTDEHFEIEVPTEFESVEIGEED